MSANEYSFHTRRQNNTNPLLNNSLTSSNNKNNGKSKNAMPLTGSVRSIIMQQYDYFLNLKISNEKIKYLSETQDKISKEIISNVGLLQKAPSKDVSNQLNTKLNNLTALHKKLKSEYTDILKTELNILYENWPGIFDKIIEGVDRETLEHVLTVFEEYQKGHLDSNEAVGQGIDYMTMKYNLPKDFFDKNAVDKFNQNLHKQEQV